MNRITFSTKRKSNGDDFVFRWHRCIFYLFIFFRNDSVRYVLRYAFIGFEAQLFVISWPLRFPPVGRFFFQNDLHTFFSIEEGTGGTWKCQRQNNFDNRDRNSITARRGWIFVSERYSIQWPKRFNRSFGKRWKPVDRISRYTSLSIRVSVVVDQIMKCAFHK